MNNKSFDDKRIASGYAKDRPFLHSQMIELIKKDMDIKESFAKGLDVGCGAGLSSKALKMICDRVTGTDISGEMVAEASALYPNPPYDFFQSSAEEIKAPENTFDIATAAGVIGWVEEEKFLPNLSKIMKNNGVLIIYDFWITDQMQGNAVYTDWWHQSYLKNFPKPPRKENVWTQEMIEPYGFEMKKQKECLFEYEFDLESFVRFMMLQSNVNAQIEEKGKTLEIIRKWFEQALAPIFKGERKTLIFKGYYWWLQLYKKND